MTEAAHMERVRAVDRIAVNAGGLAFPSSREPDHVIVIADDNPHRAHLAATLRGAGYTVTDGPAYALTVTLTPNKADP